MYRIECLLESSPRIADFKAYRQGLRELGDSEGQNIVIKQRYAAGVYGRLDALAAELVRLKVDVIGGGTPDANAAKAATTTIPIVVTLGGVPPCILVRADQVIQ